MTSKNTNDELQVGVDSLESPISPLTGQHKLPPLGPQPAREPLIDKTRLLQAWDNNVKTLREVIRHLERNRKAQTWTRIVVVGSLAILIALGFHLVDVIKESAEGVERAKQAVEQSAARTDARLEQQETKMDLVLNAMAELLEAKLAEEAASQKPKDPILKKEAVRARVQALGSALKARKEVAPAPAAVEAVQKLQELRQEAAAKGLDVQLPAP